MRQVIFLVSLLVFGLVANAGMTIAEAKCRMVTINILKLTENGFTLKDTVSINEQNLVCNAEHLPYQEAINQMRQQQGWYGHEWSSDGTHYRAVRPDVTRWNKGMQYFLNPDSKNASKFLS